MTFYDSDDFDEEFVDEEEEANAFEVTMAAVFEGQGSDPEAALSSARATAEDTIFEGDWEVDEGKLVVGPDSKGVSRFEFTAIGVVEADSVEEAIDIAASGLSDDWELVGDPMPVYIDDLY